MHSSSFVCRLLGLAAVAVAFPPPPPDACGLDVCQVVDFIVDILDANPIVDPFCLSILGISTVVESSTVYQTLHPSVVLSTVQSTKTATQTVSFTATATIVDYVTDTLTDFSTVPTSVTIDSTISETATETETGTITDTISIASTDVIVDVAASFQTVTLATDTITDFVATQTATSTHDITLVDKRGKPFPGPETAIPTPACLVPYGSSLISDACSCFGLPTPTTTKLTTVTLSETPTTVLVTKYTTVTSTYTDTITSDVTSDQTVTASTLLTSVSTVIFVSDIPITATVDVTAIATASVTTEVDITQTSTSTDVVITSITESVTDSLTATTTVPVSATVTPICANAEPTYALSVVGGAYNGEYLFSTPFVGQGANLASAQSTITPAVGYTLIGTTLYDYTGSILSLVSTGVGAVGGTYAEFYPASTVASGTNTPYVCAIGITTEQLTCSIGLLSQFMICDISGPVLVAAEPGVTFPGVTCTNVKLNVQPLCIVFTSPP